MVQGVGRRVWNIECCVLIIEYLFDDLATKKYSIINTQHSMFKYKISN